MGSGLGNPIRNRNPTPNPNPNPDPNVAHVQRLRDASERQDGAPVEPAMLAKMAAVQASLRQQVLSELVERL